MIFVYLSLLTYIKVTKVIFSELSSGMVFPCTWKYTRAITMSAYCPQHVEALSSSAHKEEHEFSFSEIRQKAWLLPLDISPFNTRGNM